MTFPAREIGKGSLNPNLTFRHVPPYPKFVAPEDHRADTAHDVVNVQIQHLSIGRVLLSLRYKHLRSSYLPRWGMLSLAFSPFFVPPTPCIQSHICQKSPSHFLRVLRFEQEGKQSGNKQRERRIDACQTTTESRSRIDDTACLCAESVDSCHRLSKGMITTRYKRHERCQRNDWGVTGRERRRRVQSGERRAGEQKREGDRAASERRTRMKQAMWSEDARSGSRGPIEGPKRGTNAPRQVNVSHYLPL